MSQSAHLQTRVDPSVKDRVLDYKESAGEPTQSDAVRRLIVEGLETREAGFRQRALEQLGSSMAALLALVATFHGFTPYIDGPDAGRAILLFSILTLFVLLWAIHPVRGWRELRRRSSWLERARRLLS